MKKTMIIITAAIYLIAIVIIVSIGYVAEVVGVPVYAEDIVLRYEPFPYEHYENGALIYTISYNENPDPSSEVTKDQFPYVIEIKEYEYFYYYTDHEINLYAEAISSKGEVTNKALSYYIDSSKKEFIEVTPAGFIKFNSPDDFNIAVCNIKTTDGTNILKQVYITW